MERRPAIYLTALLAALLAVAVLVQPGPRRAKPDTAAPGLAAAEISPRVYMPLVTNGYFPPLFATSYYMDTVNTSTLYNMGCALGTRDLNLPGTQNSIVILDFGKPVAQMGVQGSSIFSFTFVNTLQIGTAAQYYLQGYWDCSASDTTSQLRLGIGTSNFGTQVTYEHGAAWADMVNLVGDWLLNTGYASQMKVAGANDMELAWNSPTTTRAWMNGYDSINEWRHYDYGAAEGCPPYGTCGTSSYPTWTSEDVWYIAWGAPPAYSLPEIYLTSGGNAAQWYNLSLYGYLQHGSKMEIDGALTQYQACQQRGCNPLVANTPEQGWTQLWTALNSDARTAQDLPWSSDIRWLDSNAGSPLAAAQGAAPAGAAPPPGPTAEPQPPSEEAEIQGLEQALDAPLTALARESLEEKLAVVRREAAARESAVPPFKPAQAVPPALAPEPEPERPTGILEDVQGPFSAQEFIIENAWQERVNGQWTQVYAGALATDPTQGVVIVRVSAPDGTQGSLHGTPGKVGAVRLVAADGTRLTLQAADGTQFVFDVEARRFTTQ